MIWRLFVSELPKQKRTFTPWLLAIGPVTVVAFGILPAVLRSDGSNWLDFLSFIANWWGTLWVPFGGALLATLAVAPETKGGVWRALRVRPVHPAGLYLAKAAILAVEGVVCSLAMAGLALLAGASIVAPGQPVPWGMLGALVLVPLVGALPVMSLHLWVATAQGFGPAITLVVGGFLSQIFLMSRPAWFLSPWAYPMRGIMSAFGVGANADLGQAVEISTALAGALPVLLIALAVAAAFSAAGAAWFSRSEVK